MFKTEESVFFYLEKRRFKKMKKLTLFQRFDFAAWAKDKQFMIQAVKYNDKKGCVSIDVVIVNDKTNYGDPSISNIFEKFKVHCIQDTKEEDVMKYGPQDKIIFKSVGKCSVYGDYNNSLSVEAVVEVVK